MVQTSQASSQNDKTKKKGVWGKIYSFMLCGGWILALVAILGIVIYLDNVLK